MTPCGAADQRRSATPAYAAVIRAYQDTPLLHEAIAALRRQTTPPAAIVIVDSSTDPATTQAFHALGATVVPYPDGEFNFSKAINLGIAAVDQAYALIISAHVLAADPALVERSFGLAAVAGAEVFFWWPREPDEEERAVPVTRRSFNGRNGMANAMAMVAVAHVRRRPFREDVFSAEDQEWTRYYLTAFGRPMLRIESPAVAYRNPHHSSQARNELKVINEELAIGHYVRRRLIWPDRIAMRALRGVRAMLHGDGKAGRMHLGFAWAMVKANFTAPRARSRYF